MTDRLKSLLHAEVDSLDVPPVPATEILGAGRRLRRRRTGAIWGSAALVVAVVTGGAVVARTAGDSETPAPAAPPPAQIAWAADDTVYVGTDGRPAVMPEVAQTLYYTSAGILVRTNKDGASDGGAPFHFQLVATDGTVSPVHVTLGEVIPSTDPSEPYLAWATRTGGRIQVVVHDVAADRDVAAVDVPGAFTWGGWDAPPVALSGDLVYVGTDDRTAVVNWRTGEVTTTDVLAGNQVPEVSGGRTVTTRRANRSATADVVEAATGRDLLDIPVRLDDQVTLSPDGRFALVVSGAFDPPIHQDVYDVGTGRSVRLPSTLQGYGWTSDGDLFQVVGTRLDVCSSTTGTCEPSTVPKTSTRDLVRYGGLTYES